jgi:hypothetical protein
MIWETCLNQGHHYQRWGQGNQRDVSYVNLLDQGLVYFYPRLMCASKFVMHLARHRVVSNTLIYCMFAKTEMLICASLPKIEDTC